MAVKCPLPLNENCFTKTPLLDGVIFCLKFLRYSRYSLRLFVDTAEAVVFDVVMIFLRVSSRMFFSTGYKHKYDSIIFSTKRWAKK
jgi:hypothetical protein